MTKPLISYNAIKYCQSLDMFTSNHSHSQLSKDSGQLTEEENMVEGQIVGWDEVGRGSQFVTLEQDKRKTIVLKEWKLQKTDKWGKEQVEFAATVVEEDNKECSKQWTATSRKLIAKLKPILSTRDPATEVRLSVKKIGDKFDTSYDIELLN